jgi:hypothetical protein
LGATLADTTVIEPGFVVERFGAAGDRLEVAGHWHGLRGRRFVRPVLWLHRGETRRRLVAVLDHKPWAADDGEPWFAAFAWDGGALDFDRAELEVGRELVVELPLPGRKPPPSTPARPRRPSELERTREELSAATRERRALQAALDTATSDAGDLERLRAERDRAVEAAERARADGERLVNDEYRQRERAQEALDRATERARDTEAALDLARRQLTAARTSYARLEAERDEARQALAATIAEADKHGELLATAQAERDEARERLAVAMAEGDEMRAQLEAAAAERERLLGATVEHDVLAEPEAAPEEPAGRESDELVAARAEQQRLEAELAGAWSDREQLAAELAAARAGRERVEAELVAARSDRKRLERELAGRVEPPEPRPTIRVTPQPFTTSRIAPPSSGGGLWMVRIIALAMVAALFAGVGLLLAGMF